VNFSPSVGEEVAKLRPAVIINNDTVGALRVKLVVPITNGQKPSRTWHVRIKPSPGNGLRKESLIDCFQLKSVSHLRFTKKIGILSTKDIDSVKVCLAEILDLL
ncbi:MAG TPA: type II toxin-antitoxin system PemK/MazF family toxin, partial [Cyclobacteriaceae bacterium]